MESGSELGAYLGEEHLGRGNSRCKTEADGLGVFEEQ